MATTLNESSPPTGRVCPTCKSKQVYRSHRKGLLERVLLPLIGRRPYRCHDCGHRFHAWRFGSGRR